MRDLGDNLTSGLISFSSDYERKLVYHQFGHQEPRRPGGAFYFETSMVRMKTLQSGFTLIELLIVIAIIGILATVALPYYQGYMIRAKLVEVENAMATVKSAVSSYRQEKDGWPECSDIAAIRTSLGVGLGAIQRISAISVAAGTGTITATVTGIHTMVEGKTIMLKPDMKGDGSFSWAWDYGPGFPIQLRQKGYR